MSTLLHALVSLLLLVLLGSLLTSGGNETTDRWFGAQVAASISLLVVGGTSISLIMPIGHLALPLFFTTLIGAYLQRTHLWVCRRALLTSVAVASPSISIVAIPDLINTVRGVVNPAPSADLISFGSVALWLEENSLLSMHESLPQTIGWSWMSNHTRFFFPNGDAILANLLDFAPRNSLLVPTRVVALIALGTISLSLYHIAIKLGTTRLIAFLISTSVSTSLALTEVVNAHSIAFLLGSSVFTGLLSLVINDGQSDRFSPLWIHALLNAGLLSIYPQYLLLTIPMYLVVWTHGQFRGHRAHSALYVPLVALLMNPVAVWIAVRFLSSTGASREANFFDNPYFVRRSIDILMHWSILGPVLRTFSATGVLLSAALAMFIIAWWLACLGLTRRASRTLVWLLLLGIAGVVALGSIFEADYSQFRLMRMLQVLLLVAVCIGLAFLFRERRWLATLMLGTIFIANTLGIHFDPYVESQSIRDRSLDDTYLDLDIWLRDLQIYSEEVLVVSEDFITTHFALIALRERVDVKAPVLPNGYLSGSATSPWSAQPARWLIVDRLMPGYVDANAIVRTNSRFLLVDATEGHFELFLRGMDSRQNYGTNPLNESRYRGTYLTTFHSVFVLSNQDSVFLNIGYGGQPFGLAITANVNDQPGYYSRTVKSSDSVRIKIPILDSKRWTMIYVRNLSPTQSPPVLLFEGTIDLCEKSNDCL